MKATGMSLIECVIVLALLGLVAAISLPHAREARAAFDLRFAAERLAGELAEARARAISRNSPLTVQIGESGEAYGFAAPGGSPREWRVLPAGVAIVAAPSRPVTFYSRGNAAPAGTFVLQSPAGRVRVIVAPMGRVRWEWSRPE